MKGAKLSLVAVLLVAFLVTPEALAVSAEQPKRPMVVVSISPLYLIAKEVVGDRADLRVLVVAGVDPHHYSPSPQDALLVESCDLFICTGREEFLGQLPPCSRKISWNNWTEEKDVIIKNDNPHYLWLYPPNAKIVARKVAEAMSQIDSLNSGYYLSQAQKFAHKLEALEQWLSELKGSVKLTGKRVLLIADHFEPLVEWMGLDIVYVVARGEALPGPKDIGVAMEKAKDCDLIIVSATQSEGDEGRIGRQIAEGTGTPLAYLYGIPTSSEDNYFDFIKRNVVIVAGHLAECSPSRAEASGIDVFALSTIALAAVAALEGLAIVRLRRSK